MVFYFTNMTTQIENTLYKAFLGEDAKVCIAHARGAAGSTAPDAHPGRRTHLQPAQAIDHEAAEVPRRGTAGDLLRPGAAGGQLQRLVERRDRRASRTRLGSKGAASADGLIGGPARQLAGDQRRVAAPFRTACVH